MSRRVRRGVAIAFAAGAVLLAVTAGAHGAPRSQGQESTEVTPAELLARSFSHPLRIVGPSGRPAGADSTAGAAAVRLLADAERAYDAVTLGLGMPAPDVDPATGMLTITLAPPALAAPLGVELVREPMFAYDRAFARIRLASPWSPGCARDHALATAFARASLARLSPAIVERDARGLADALADLATPCAAPQAPPATPLSLARDATGTAAFWEDLDSTYGADPGRLLTAMADLSATRTNGHLPPQGDDPFLPSPDVYTVLRASFADALVKGSTFDDVLLDLAVRRVFAREGADLAVDWRIEWPETPRRIALTPLEPCGAAYTVVQLPDAAGSPGKHLRLRLEASWEEHATLRFALLALGPDGRLLRRLDPPAIYRASSLAQSFVDLDGATAVVVVVTSTGDPDVSLSLPIDDARSLESHVALLTLAAE